MTDKQLAVVFEQLRLQLNAAYVLIDRRLIGELDAPTPDILAEILMPLSDIDQNLEKQIKMLIGGYYGDA